MPAGRFSSPKSAKSRDRVGCASEVHLSDARVDQEPAGVVVELVTVDEQHRPVVGRRDRHHRQRLVERIRGDQDSGALTPVGLHDGRRGS